MNAGGLGARAVCVPTWRHGGRELWTSGGAMQACRRGGMEGMELWRRAAGVQTWTYGGMERWRRAAGVAIWWCGGSYVWGRVVGVATWRRRSMEVWRRGTGMGTR